MALSGLFTLLTHNTKIHFLSGCCIGDAAFGVAVCGCLRLRRDRWVGWLRRLLRLLLPLCRAALGLARGGRLLAFRWVRLPAFLA